MVAGLPEPVEGTISNGAHPGLAEGSKPSQAGIFRRDGIAWRRLDGGLPQPLAYMPYSLLTEPGAPGHITAGLANGEVWHSENYGDDWARLPFSLGRIERTLVRV